MPNRSVEEIRVISKALLGSRTRLEVADLLGGRVGRLVYVRDVARELRLNDQDVKRDFTKFVAGDILNHQGRAVLNGPDHYQPVPSLYWTFARELLAELKATSPEAQGGESEPATSGNPST